MELPAVSEAPRLFREYLGQNGLVLEEMTPRQGVDAVLGFFKKQRFGFDGSDWVLFQCGTHDWGNGKHFEFNLTRQLAVNQTDEYIARMERAGKNHRTRTTMATTMGEVYGSCH